MPKITIYTCEPCGYSCGNRKSSYEKHLASTAHQCKVECNAVKSEPVSRIQELEQLLREKDAKIETLTMQLQMKDEMISILKQFGGGGGCQIVSIPTPPLAAAQPPPPPPTPAIVVEERKKSFNKEHFLNVVCKDAKNIEDIDFNDFIDGNELFQLFKKGRGTNPVCYANSSIVLKLFKRVIESMPETQRPVWCFDSKRHTYMERINGQWEQTGGISSGGFVIGSKLWNAFISFLVKITSVIKDDKNYFPKDGGFNPFLQGFELVAFYGLVDPSSEFSSNLSEYLKVDKIKYAV